MSHQKPIFNAQLYDRRHLRQLASRMKGVQALYWEAIDKLCNRGERWLNVEPGKELHFEDFPQFNRKADAAVRELAHNLQVYITQGNEEAWTLANLKNDKMVHSMGLHARVPKDKLDEWTMPHLEALEQFNTRVVSGMNLSERVWSLAKPFKDEMELALEIGIGDGLSATDLSREVRKYLNEPNRLFRRVRDRDGNLRLSKAAQAYHPGRGVYRSSYKNALRMTATENNMAYRTADHNRWKQLDFVIGIQIGTSPTNHPEVDICDELKGTYPKDFKFVGWHPWCRCIATAKTASDKQFDDYIDRMIAGEDVQGFHFEGEVTDMPECFTDWVRDNSDRIARAKSTPYFISDNVQQVDKILGRNPESDIMGHIDRQLREAPKNPAVEAHRKQIEDFMAQAVKQSDIAIRMSEQSLLQVIEDEMFKTASDTGTNTFVKAERWKQYMEERAATEKALYGTSGRTTYGYLESKEIGAETTSKQLKRYGEIVVRLRKDAIRTATWTPDDSMAMYRERGMVRRTKAAEWKEGYYRPSDIRHPNASMFADKRSKWIDNMLQTDPKNAREFFNTHGLYSEVQIHGQLGIQAIDSVTLPFSLEGKKYAAWAERAERLRERGIKVYYKKAGKFVEYKPAGTRIPKLGEGHLLVREEEKIANAMYSIPGNNPKNTYTKKQVDNHRETERAIGVKKGKDMNHQEANTGNVNIDGKGKKAGQEYKDNCQCCVVTYELRRRGFNVKAAPHFDDETTIPFKIGAGKESAWIGAQRKTVAAKNGVVLEKDLNAQTQAVGRYHIEWDWKGKSSGHIVTAERLPNGKLIIYDPQDSTYYSLDFLTKTEKGIVVTRVDNLRINAAVISEVVRVMQR